VPTVKAKPGNKYSNW